MNKRLFGKTGAWVSEIGLGTWQLGTKWGEAFNSAEAEAILQAALDKGISFIDTADVYIGGESERAIGRFLKKHKEAFYVTTKCGRGLKPHTADMYTPKAMETFIDASLSRLGLEQLDMVLLHCPPSSVYQNDALFAGMDAIKAKGKVANYGVSIETCDEGIKAMDYHIAAIEVIVNMFRQKPLEQLFPAAKKNQIGIIARVPLASGLLTGTFHKDTVFSEKDHRTYNRNGEAFDKGETFSGVDFDKGLQAVAQLKQVLHTENLIPFALKWILMQDAVSVVIPGASKVSQVISNVSASDMPDLTQEQMQAITQVYETYIKPDVHQLW